MEDQYKEVYFTYCNTCKHRDKNETDDPCNECLTNFMRLYSHKPINYEEDENYIKKEFGYYDSIRKIKDYLYEISYSNLNVKKAMDYFKKQEDIPAGGCSAICANGYFGRNFDWNYSEQAEFVVHTPNTLGIAGGFSKLTNEYVQSGKRDDLYFVLPFQLQDGINRYGVSATINVVPTDYGFNKSKPAISNENEISALMLIRFILDRFKTAKEAVDYIHDYVSVYFPKTLHNMNYEVHYMVSDMNKSYVIEFVENKTKIIDVSGLPYITNFHMYNAVLRSNNTVFTPETQHSEFNAIEYNNITPNGSGLERYNLIAGWFNDTIRSSIVTKNSIRDLLDSVKYTKSYISSPEPSDPYWYTEFVGNGLTVISNPEDFAEIIAKAGEEYTKRLRSTGKTWHTMHSSIYDMNAKILYLVTQEDGDELIFNL